MASGPVHTFFSRSTTTTVDYIIGNLATSTAIVSCIVEEEHPLNTSDHLPIISNLNLSLLTLAPCSSDQNDSLDWNSALRHGCIPQYASLTDEAVAPLLNKDYCSVEEIEADISHVSNVLIEASTSTIPHFRCSNSNSNRISDPHLSSLCWQSRVAYRQWKAAGCPRSGPLFEARRNCKKHVQQHLSKCRARVQCANIQKRDQSFHSKHPKRFQKKQQKKGGTSLLVNGSLTSDPSVILPHWAHHFSSLGTSHCSTSPSL